MKPGKVAAVFVIPISNPENRGAISKWLILNPARAQPWNPTAIVNRETALSESVAKYPHSSKNTAPEEKAVQGCRKMFGNGWRGGGSTSNATVTARRKVRNGTVM